MELAPWEKTSSSNEQNTNESIKTSSTTLKFLPMEENVIEEYKPKITKDNIDIILNEVKEDDIPDNDWFEKQQKEELKKAMDVDVYDLEIKGAQEIEISASLMKQFFGVDFRGNDFERPICPRKLYVENILRRYNMTSEAMLNGLYFEYGCYGKTAKDEQAFDDLPRLKLRKTHKDKLRKAGVPPCEWKGAKSTDHKRIDLQIEHFYKKVQEYNVFLDDSNVQTQIKLKNKEGITIRMTADIFPTVLLFEHENGLITPTLANIDLKLTKNVDSTHGDFSWGNPEKMDHTQAYLYSFIGRHIDYKQNPHLDQIIYPTAKKLLRNGQMEFIYWVFGYNSDNIHSEFKPIRIPYDDNTEKYVIDKIHRTAKLLDYYASTGWDAIGEFDLCRKCPLNANNGGKCEDYKTNKSL